MARWLALWLYLLGFWFYGAPAVERGVCFGMPRMCVAVTVGWPLMITWVEFETWRRWMVGETP